MPHIVKSFDDELTRLRESVIAMGQMTTAQFSRSLDCLTDPTDEAVAGVIALDAEIDRLSQAVNEQVFHVLALRSPMADDLRLVVTAMHVATALERIGGYGVSLARNAKALSYPPLPSLRSVVRMGREVTTMLVDVLGAYGERDAARALAVWKADRQVDEAYSSLFRETITYMMEDPQNIRSCSHLMFIAKDIERVGDHATNIGEMVYFLATGRPLGEVRPKGDTSTAAGPS